MKTTVVASEDENYKSSNTNVASGFVTSIRLPDRRIWERAKEYAKERGMSIGALVAKALEQYMEREDEILSLLKELRTRIEAIEIAIERVELFPTHPKGIKDEVIGVKEENLPSFLVNNPWVKILSRRGDEH